MWKKLDCNAQDIQLLETLTGGQSFRWNLKNNVWTGVFKDTVWKLKQDKNGIYYTVLGSLLKSTQQNSLGRKRKLDDDCIFSTMLKNYFQIDIGLQKHYLKWSQADANFSKLSKKFYGIRVLKQNPIENIFSFICSSNNNISRITSLVEKLCLTYGTKICDVDGFSYYAFPEVGALAANKVESDLRNLGFGYRAKYIHESAKMIIELGGESWINDLKAIDYPLAKMKLMQLPGIGAKVADCVCLMSLGHLCAVPVDTHIFQIAKSSCYLPHLANSKTISKKTYNEIGSFFRELHGPLAGWAQTILFCADLKIFSESNTLSK